MAIAMAQDATATRFRLRRAVVLGAGTMGAQIACLLAGRGVRVDLLDLDAATAAAGLERAVRLSPSPLYLREDAAAIRPGGLETLAERVHDVDWVLEAIIEQAEAKRELLSRLGTLLEPGTLVSSNTSALPIAPLAEALGPAHAPQFLGTHFFNPPRYMRLVELVPSVHTSEAALARAAWIAGEVLGKGVVRAKDAPGFIANRLGTHATLAAMQLAATLRLGVDEVDDLSGPLLGRPRSAVFRTLDLVGLDVFASVVRDLGAAVPADDPDRALFALPAPVEEMLRRGMLGSKAGAGFYRRDGDEILALDLETLEYRPRRRPRSGVVEAARAIDEPARRLAALLAGDDVPTTFIRRGLVRSLWYAATVGASIADQVVDVDRAMRWGFGWGQGPFETVQLLGAERVAALVTAEGLAVPDLLAAAGAAGGFYVAGGTLQLDLAAPRAGSTSGASVADGKAPVSASGPAAEGLVSGQAAEAPVSGQAAGLAPTGGTPAMLPVPERPRVIELGARRRSAGTLAGNSAASLLALDGGLALELHGKLNIIGLDSIEMLRRAVSLADDRGEPLVIATDAADFSAGANLALLLLEADDEEWDELDRGVRDFQAATREMRAAGVPVAVALRGRVLGGGCEIAVASDHVQAAAETYMGFVELGMGLIPAGGGSTEMARRAAARAVDGTWGDAFPFFAQVFEAIATARVSTGAADARRLGLLRETDGISVDPDRVVTDALTAGRAMLELGYRPPLERPIRVLGRRGIAAAEALTSNQVDGRYISAYDRHLATELARVMCGGDVAEGSELSLAYLHDLEREAFLRLLGDHRTRDRIRHFLRTKKPLRN